MIKNYSLNIEQTDRFLLLAKEKNNLIMRAMIKLNIPKKLYRDFYNFGLEGLLVSFLILESREIEEKEFDYFAFSTIKRKIIDEIRRRNKHKEVSVDFLENTNLLSSVVDKDILMLEFKDYLKTTLTRDELAFAETLFYTLDIKKTAQVCNISLATAYRFQKKLKIIFSSFFDIS